MKKLLFILFIYSLPFLPQARFLGEIGKFQNASTLHINGAGFLFISDAGNDKVYKSDTLGNIHKETGGYGWGPSTFDQPTDVFSSTLNIYVSDKNNHRIQMFDKDLNFVSALSTRNSENNDARFGYPLSCAVSNQGDLYIVDSENKRVVKFDMFGNFVQNFGGYDWGKYALNNPSFISVDPANNIYVTDGKNVVIYDQFGSGIAVVKAEAEIMGLNIIYSKLTLNTDDKIFYSDLAHSGFSLQPLDLDEQPGTMVCSLVFNSRLYVLTPKTIKIYDIGDLPK